MPPEIHHRTRPSLPALGTKPLGPDGGACHRIEAGGDSPLFEEIDGRPIDAKLGEANHMATCSDGKFEPPLGDCE
jgi:hypothetical protein